MNIKPSFAFTPLPPLAEEVDGALAELPNPLGPLHRLPGHWTGTGFNMIYRPIHDGTPQTHFLELNLTDEIIDFTVIQGPIPNRGLVQGDIAMFGLSYLQQVSDANLSTPGNTVGLHVEPGVWLNVPQTTDPAVPASVVRMASIPHGTTMLAQGLPKGQQGSPAPFDAPPAPFPQVRRLDGSQFLPPEADLSTPTPYRSSGQQVANITQSMLDDPTSILNDLVAGQTILSTMTLAVTTSPDTVTLGGGTSNTAFLVGGPDGPNANATLVESTFWIQLVQGTGGQPNFNQLQYRQVVYLEFAGALWPHVSVATLVEQAS